MIGKATRLMLGLVFWGLVILIAYGLVSHLFSSAIFWLIVGGLSFYVCIVSADDIHPRK